jgi:UPF0716 protein FxsA
VWWKLILLFTVVPTIEIFVLLQIGSVIGPTPTFLLLLLSGALGAWLARREGLSVLRQLSDDLQRGLPPADRLAEGALVLLGATLLITPGVVTDLVGLLILVPGVRRWLAPKVVRWLSASFGVPAMEVEAGPDLGEGVRYRREPAVHERPKATPFSSPFD